MQDFPVKLFPCELHPFGIPSSLLRISFKLERSSFVTDGFGVVLARLGVTASGGRGWHRKEMKERIYEAFQYFDVIIFPQIDSQICIELPHTLLPARRRLSTSDPVSRYLQPEWLQNGQQELDVQNVHQDSDSAMVKRID